MATEAELKAQVSTLADRLEVPGVAVGVVIGDEDHAAFHGVTSVEDPLPIDAGTLFQTGSTGKTYTSTAILRLVERGEIDLDAPVRTYVPELKLKDEQVIRELILEPLGMAKSFFFAKEIMTYRFANGHRQSQDGKIEVTRPWELGRYGAPMGGMTSNVADQLNWARFHLGNGTAKDGTRILSEEMLRRMQQPTVECPGNALGDAVGISWLLRDTEGLKVVAHGGDTAGQHSIFEMVPERGFAITSLTNCGPNGGEFNEEIFRWAFQAYLGIEIKDPEPIHLEEDALAEYAGRYETIAAIVDLKVGEGLLVIETEIRPEVLEQLGEEPEDDPPIPIGILSGDGDRYIVPDGPAKGMRGYFTRDDDGKINGIHIGGRYAERVP